MLALTGIFLLSVFYGSYWLGRKLSMSNKNLAMLGGRTYHNKITQLKEKKFFAPLRKHIEAKSLVRCTNFLFPLILIKSIFSLGLSLFLLAPLLLIFQGLIMGSMIRHFSLKTGGPSPLNTITFWQLLSQISMMSLGTKLGYLWLIKGEILSMSWLLSTEAGICILISLITAFMAARLEAGFLLELDVN